MAGDWIKMRCDLQTHPKVRRIASAIGADKLRAIGALHAVWSIFDAHSIDGVILDYTHDDVDAEVNCIGISRAMEAVEWIEVADGNSLRLPRFTEHNGHSAKRRANEQRRKKSTRAKRPHSVRKVSASKRTKSGPEKRREEKRRIEKSLLETGERESTNAGATEPMGWGAYTARAREVSRWTKKQPPMSEDAFAAAFEAEFELTWDQWCAIKDAMAHVGGVA